MRRIYFLSLILLTLFSLEISAQELVTDRPDQTESSVTIPLNSFQIETGLLTGFTKNFGISERQFLIPTTLLRYGMTKNIELRIVEQFENRKIILESDGMFGVSDLELGAKIQILKKEDINTEIAFLTHLILPTGSESFTNGNLGTVNKIAVSHTINDFLDFGYNVGYNFFGSGRGDLIYSMALGIGITDNIGAYIETYGEIVEFNNPYSNFDSGFTYLIQENLQLDLSFGIGLNYSMNYFSVGCSWNIPGRTNK
jgi:hypothetical protein